ncbi:MAG: 2-octaprenyl-6-methoxyphenyl hydroxylase [Enterobacteriaceae bacterium]
MKVIIVGGGMTGATLALVLHTLTQGRLTIDLIESYPPNHEAHPGFDARVIALAQGTCQQLQALGLWPQFADHAEAIRTIHVSDQGHAGAVTLTAQEYQLTALGQVVALQPAGQNLFHRLRSTPGITVHCPARVEEVHRSTQQVSVLLDSGDRIEGELLIAADGSHSSVARDCHCCWHQHDYQQVAVITNVETAEPHRGRAFERFTPQGPLALLPMATPLSDRYSTVVWCHPLAQQAQVAAWDEAEFCQRLQKEFGWRLGRIERCAQRHFYPLTLQIAEQHISHRLALVGNAAQTLHPVAGQGFNLALRDVLTLAETLEQAVRAGEDPGSYSVLAQYQRRRQPDQQATVAMTEGLLHLFANRHFPLVAARNAGLMLLDSVPGLRNKLIHRTLGWVER